MANTIIQGGTNGGINYNNNQAIVESDGALKVDASGSEIIINPLASFQTSQYSIGTSAVQITATPLSNRQSISLKAACQPGNQIFIGNSSAVTISTGYILNNGDSVVMDLGSTEPIYAIANAIGQVLYVLEAA